MKMDGLYFAANPRATILLVLLLFAAGIGSLMTMGRQEDPSLTRRFAVITTQFPGAPAERVEALVTEPLETAIREIPEVREVASVTRANISVLAVETREDINEAEVEQTFTEVREAIARARENFPAGVEQTSLTQQYIGAATMVVSLKWDDQDEAKLGMLNRVALDLRDRFQSLPGTEQTELFGDVAEEVRVLVDADTLASLGLTTRDVAGVLRAADAKAPAGQLQQGERQLGVEVSGEFESLDRIRAVPIPLADAETSLRVGDIARLQKAIRSPPQAIALMNGERAIFVAAYLRPNLRVDQWTLSALDMVGGFKSGLPPGLTAEIVFQQNVYVEERLNGLAGNMLVSALIVFAVLFFLMGWRAAIVVGTALPLTILSVLFIINMTGEPLHQMSVTGIVIALGMLIDNAIVMADEYSLRRRRGAAQMEAARKSVHHLFLPLLASTATTIFAFAPIALLPGGAGEFVGFIGLSVMFAVGMSFLLAMTVIPAFSIWLDDEHAHDHEPSAQRFWQEGFVYAPLTRAYRNSLRFVLGRPIYGVLAGFAMAATGFWAMSQLPLQFFPATDRDAFQLSLTLPTTASLAETREAVEHASAIIREEEGIIDIGWVVGQGAPRTYYNVFAINENEPNFAGGWVRTTGPDATRRAVINLQRRLRDALPEARVLALPFEQGPPVPAPIELRVIGPDFQELDRLGNELRELLAQSSNVTYTVGQLRLGAPVLQLQADERAARLTGRSLSDIAGLLQADLDGVIGGSLLEANEELPVRVLLDDAARGDINSVRTKSLPDGNGGFIPVSALGELTLSPEVALITRLDGERDNTVYAFTWPFTFADTVFQEFRQRLEASDFQLPDGYRLEIGGEAEARGDAMGNLFATAVPLIILIVGSLVLAFNSFRHAAVVGLVGVQSVFIAMLAVFLFGQPNGFNAIIGAMGLLGLSINGAIVVLTALATDERSAHRTSMPRLLHLYQTRVEGGPAPQRRRWSKILFWRKLLGSAIVSREMSTEDDLEGIIDTTVDATRHIVATTLTTMGGFLPLILAGDAFWLPLSAAIAGGVAGSAILALYTVPAYYTVLVRRRRLREVRRAVRRKELDRHDWARQQDAATPADGREPLGSPQLA